MNKQDFLLELRKKLNGIPQDELEERLNFYEEMIDDRIEEGLSEEEAILELGTLDSITKQVMSEIPLIKLVKQKINPGRALCAWEIILLILGSPIWIPLLVAFIAVALSIYVVLWCVIIMIWAVDGTILGTSIGCSISSIVIMLSGNIPFGLAMLGVGIVSVGLSILGFFGSKYATKAIIILTKKIFIWMKSQFIKKEMIK